MHALGFMTKTIQTGFSRALGKTPQKTIRKNVEWQEDQITSPSPLKLPAK